MKTIKSALSRKLFGKVPVWAVVAVGTVAGYLYYRHKKATTTSTTQAPPVDTSGFGGLGDSGFAGGGGVAADNSGGGGGGGLPTPLPGSTTTTPPPLTIVPEIVPSSQPPPPPSVAPAPAPAPAPVALAARTTSSTSAADFHGVTDAEIAAGQAALNQPTVVQPAAMVSASSYSTAAPAGSVIVPGPIVGGVAKPATVLRSAPAPQPARTTHPATVIPSGAGAVKAGAVKKNYQAAARAA